MAVNARNGELVASFPVEDSDEIMLVTDGGQLIRVPVEGIRIAGRATQGVIVFDTAEQERVVSVERIGEPEAEDEEDGAPSSAIRPSRANGVKLGAAERSRLASGSSRDVDTASERSHGRNSRASAGAGPPSG